MLGDAIGLIKDNYRIGIDEIDSQHIEWLKIYIDMKEYIQKRTFSNNDDIDGLKLIIVKMYRYTRMHLKYEEKFMEIIQYPHLIEHKQEHRKMDSLISNYFVKMIKDEPISYSQLSKEIGEWLMFHIMGSDKKYAVFISDNNINYKELLPLLE